MYELEAQGGASGILDIVSGNNTFVELSEEGAPLLTIKGYEARRGYDMASGLGTVDGFAFAHALAGK